MTTLKTTEARGGFRLPDPPEREPDDMTSFDHLSVTGAAYLLSKHFGSPDTTIVAGEHYITPVPTQDMTGVKYPDLLIAFDVDPEAYRDSNAYVISEQGKSPDFVLEVASRRTGKRIPGRSARYTQLSGFQNTGASTRRGSTTARGWPATAS